MRILLLNGSIQFNAFYDRIIEIFEFTPKKKYVEKLVETDISDEEEEENDEDEGDAGDEGDDGDYHLSLLFKELGSIEPIDPIEPIEQVASNRTQINQSIRSEMASRSMTQSATTQVDGFCPHCGKQFSMRGMTRHKNKCKENFT